jgi:hypothetical protein
MLHNDKKSEESKSNNEDAPLKPNEETLHTTDPQEHMSGPVSSFMHNTGDSFDTDQTREEANAEKNRNSE